MPPVATTTATVTETPAAPAKQSTANLDSEAINRVWRGNKEGTIKLDGYPDCWNATDEQGLLAKRQYVKEHLALVFRYWGAQGFNEGAAGHITVRDPILRDHYWMNPFGVHFSAMTVSRLVLVTPEGYVHPTLGAQLAINAAGFFIHSSIHKARPEVEAIGHCHSVHGKAWSAFGRPVDITNQDSCLFYNNLSVYKSFGGVVLAADEGARIAAALGPKNRCGILQNHGLLTVGDSVDEVGYLFALLDKQCHVQLMIEAAEANGIKKNTIDDADAAFTAATLQHPSATFFSIKSELDLIAERQPETLK